MTSTAQRDHRLHQVHSGQQIDGFKVGALLAEGGMARLYHVTKRGSKLPLVMKVPRLEHGAPVSAMSGFENELRILERLKGPHVPRLVGHGDLRHTPYLVMEYLPGDELARAVDRAPLAAAEVAKLGVALCQAVHDIHHQNVIHLDLNPRNVRARPDGTAVLIDFGIAHHALLPDLIDAAFGAAEGTTPYIAPEQVKHLRSESRSDVYAIGAILYLLATGTYPFGRPNLLSVNKRLFQPPMPPRAHNRDVPPWLQEVILRCLEIRPDDRYATPKRVAYALAHPEVVHLSRRAHRVQRANWWTRTRLWWRSFYQVFDEGELLKPAERLTRAPHVLVPLDPSHASPALNQALRAAVRKFARNETHGYFTFLSVLPAAGATARPRDASAAERLVEIRNWAQPLHLRVGRATFHVASGDPARVIIDYARHHVLDYIIMGARGASLTRRFLGSVSARVVAESPCSVTVVRARERGKTDFRKSSRRRKQR